MSGTAKYQASALALAAWIGASLITVAVVAPGAFAVLPSRTMAGSMVGSVLPALFVAGIMISLGVAAVTGIPAAPGATRGATVTAVLAAVACAFSQFVVTPRLDRLRAEIGGPVDALAPEDARRVAFGLYHGYNVAGLGVAMLGAAVCLCFLLYAMRPRT